MVKIAINGFGRIGRMVLRAALDTKNIEVVAVNDLTSPHTLAHLLKYDSAHGKLSDVREEHGNIIVGDKCIQVLSERDPEKLPWGDMGIDIVVESTGFFRSREGCEKHLKAGAKKVLLSAPPKLKEGEEAIKIIVKGVNEHTIESSDTVVSCASCTTNSLAPLVKVLNDNFGVVRGFMTTVHAMTGDQMLVDGPHSDLRRARSAPQSICPTTTGAAKAVSKVIPELKGKLDGLAMRVPVIDGSVTDFVCELKTGVSVEDLNTLFFNVASNELKDVVEFSSEPLVSVDIVGNPHSSIVDSLSTKVLDGNLVKIVAWYDNEWGYSNRMVDLLTLMNSVEEKSE